MQERLNMYRVIGFYEPYQTWQVEVIWSLDKSSVFHVPAKVAPTEDAALAWLDKHL